MDIHFSSGKIQTVEEEKLDKFILELKSRGIRLMRDVTEERILIVPLNSNTIEFIEQKINVKTKPVEIEKKELSEEEELQQMKEELEQAAKEVDSKKDVEEKREEAIKELMAKSNCAHTEKSIHVQQTSTGPRYFPVCNNCGLRERYVKAANLTDEQKMNALVWAD